MSFYGHADLDQPLNVGDHQLYRVYGAASTFCLVPRGCTIGRRASGEIDFRLDLIRGPADDAGAWATLDMQLEAVYDTEAALALLRRDRPAALLSPCMLADWSFRALRDAGLFMIPPELLTPQPLASNGLGSARLVVDLPLQSGQLLGAVVEGGHGELNAVAEADIEGVSPVVPVVVRFRASALLAWLAPLADSDGIVARQALVDRLADPKALADVLEITGTIQEARVTAFAETMVDRIAARFVQPAESDLTNRDARFRLIDSAPETEETDVRWSLSQPFLVKRRLFLQTDLLADIRRYRDSGLAASLVTRHTRAALPPLGTTTLLTYCSLPPNRVGVVALGVTTTFAPSPPERPGAQSATAIFEPPDDLARLRLRLSPGEALDYTVATFAVTADDTGVHRFDGEPKAHRGPTVRLTPDDFPVDFAIIAATPAVAELAVVEGVCRYWDNGVESGVPFRFDSGTLSASIPLPKTRTAQQTSFMLLERNGSQRLFAGLYDATRVLLDLPALASYGPQRATIEITFDPTDGTADDLIGIDLLAESAEDVPENIASFAFVPGGPKRQFDWFSASPFRPGLNFRVRRETGGNDPWRPLPLQNGTCVLRAADLRPPESARETQVASSRIGLEVVPLVSKRAPGAVREAYETAPPISSVGDPDDEVLFADPADDTRHYYLPRYGLGVEDAGLQQHYRLALTPAPGLSVMLVGAPAPEIAEEAKDATPLTHDVELVLQFLADPESGLIKTLPFTDVRRDGLTINASLTLASIEERDEVYHALTRPERKCHLLVHRSAVLSVPQAAPRPPSKPTLPWDIKVPKDLIIKLPPRPLPTPVLNPPLVPPRGLPKPGVSPLVIRGMDVRERLKAGLGREASGLVAAVASKQIPGLTLGGFVDVLPKPYPAWLGHEAAADGTLQCRIGITNWDAYSDDFFGPSPDLPPGGSNASASRTWLSVFDARTDVQVYSFCDIASAAHLAQLNFTLPAGSAMPERVYVTMQDRKYRVSKTSDLIDTRASRVNAPPMVDARRQIDQVVSPDPFAFDPALHTYMFAGVTAGAGSGQLVRHTLSYKGIYHSYFQDSTSRGRVYFLPDSFKIARRTSAPYTPFVMVQVVTREAATPDGVGPTDVIFNYVIAPHTSRNRIEDARLHLLANPAFGAPAVTFEPLLTHNVRLAVARPTLSGTVQEQRPDVALVLQGALNDSLVMPLDDFKPLFDAITRDTATVFAGSVTIGVPGAADALVTLPFRANMADLEGELFAYVAVAHDDGSFEVVLNNKIESPLRVDALSVRLSRGGQTVEGVIVPGVLPVARLGPAESVELRVTPANALGGEGVPDVTVDLDAVTVLVDPTAVWNTILDRTTVQFSTRLSVRAVPSSFEPVPGRENDQIIAIVVEFENGGSVELTAEHPQATTRVAAPIDDVVLGRPVSSTYRYKVVVVRKDGRQDRDSEVRTGTDTIFYVIVVK